MNLIQNITADPLQQQILILPNGNSFTLQLYFMPQQYCWLIQSLTYQNFTLQGMRITNNPNLLYQWQSQLPFGLACFSNSEREPTQQQDFSSGNSSLFVLTAAEVAQWTALLAGGTV